MKWIPLIGLFKKDWTCKTLEWLDLYHAFWYTLLILLIIDKIK